MKFKKFSLYTHDLELEFEFYTKKLGFELLEKAKDTFTVRIGWTELCFKKSENSHFYHYCFLIPSNKLLEAQKWMEERLELIETEKDRKIQHFENWNAQAFYFYDASGNIAEFIVRHDLENESSQADFDSSQVLGINEIGMPTRNISLLNAQLEKEVKTAFWKGDFQRFGTNGSQEGIFILPNYLEKELWFPTDIKIKPEPFEVELENLGILYELKFEKEQVKTRVLKS